MKGKRKEINRGLKFFSYKPCNGHVAALLYPFSDTVYYANFKID